MYVLWVCFLSLLPKPNLFKSKNVFIFCRYKNLLVSYFKTDSFCPELTHNMSPAAVVVCPSKAQLVLTLFLTEFRGLSEQISRFPF